eukprot:5998378-Prymnesium_polylepis.1
MARRLRRAQRGRARAAHGARKIASRAPVRPPWMELGGAGAAALSWRSPHCDRGREPQPTAATYVKAHQKATATRFNFLSSI